MTHIDDLAEFYAMGSLSAAERMAVEEHVVTPIRVRLLAERRREAEQSAATKVDFFTLVRGED